MSPLLQHISHALLLQGDCVGCEGRGGYLLTAGVALPALTFPARTRTLHALSRLRIDVVDEQLDCTRLVCTSDRCVVRVSWMLLLTSDWK